MIKRSIALCNEKIICIESLFRVVDGEQINNPEMLSFLRDKSRNKELLCPCRCGKHLMLVAGPKTTRSQHFREYPGEDMYTCVYSPEDEKTIFSRVNVKCWMDDCFGADDLELRTKISDDDWNKLQDLPCSSISKKIAVKYYHDHVNLREKEIEAVSINSRGYKVIYVVGPNNYSRKGQYPEGLIKIQEKQGFVLILLSQDNDYESSKLKVVVYVQNQRGAWEEITVIESDLMKTYKINPEGQVLHNGEPINTLSEKLLKEYEDKNRITDEPVIKYTGGSNVYVNLPFNLTMEEIRKKYIYEEQARHEETRKNSEK